MPDTRTLVAVRHAQAVSFGLGGDRARPLTDRGAAQAQELGKQLSPWLRSAEVVLVSPAVRAQQTWASLLRGCGNGVEKGVAVITADILYDGSPAQIATSVLQHARGASTLVIGHEPTISALAFNFVKAGGATAIEYGMPTGSAAIVQGNVPWAHWRDGEGVLADFIHVPSR